MSAVLPASAMRRVICAELREAAAADRPGRDGIVRCRRQAGAARAGASTRN